VVLKKSIGSMLGLLKGPKYKKKDYIELLSMLYQTLRLAKTKGMLALEQHVEHPENSALFDQFPGVKSDHHALEFICDYLRLMTLGTDNALEVETLMDQELDVHHMEAHRVSHAVNTMAESFPGLGIVAAVLGVIKTMGSITEPPEVLGHLIAAALVGTFLGILLCYGFFGPMANAIKGIDEDDHQYLVAIKVALLAHLQGYAPAVSIEFARKTLQSNVRPTFLELEEETQNLPPV
jgi:chemotaxis protein MotA